MGTVEIKGDSVNVNTNLLSELITDKLTNRQIKTLIRLINIVGEYGNNLAPLGDYTSKRELGEVLGVDRHYITHDLDWLRKYGVFKSDSNGNWIMNPYLVNSDNKFCSEYFDLFNRG